MLNFKERLQKASIRAQTVASNAIPEDHRVPDSVYEERWNMCLNCPHLYQLTSTCKRCGCFMKVKTRMAHAACPIGNWGKHLPENK